MNTRKDRNRLSLIITLWLSVFLICGMAVAWYYLPRQVETMVQEQIGQRGMTLCDQVARNAIDGLVSDDEEEKSLILGKVLDALRSERKEFTACAITDESNKIWASFNKGEIGKKYVSPVDQKGLEVERSAAYFSPQTQSYVYNIAVPVVLKARRIGVVFAQISLSQASEDAQHVGNWILVAAAILLLIGVAGTMTIVATLPLSEAAPAPASLAGAAKAALDPKMLQEVETKKEEAAKLTEKIESLKDDEVELIRRLELHQRELDRVGSGTGPTPELLQEEATVTKRLEAKKQEEQALLARIKDLKQTSSDLAKGSLPGNLKAQEEEALKRLEAHKQAEAEFVKRLENLKSEESARIEAKRREEAALSAKIEEIRKKVLELDRRIVSRRREEMELDQRLEKRKQEVKDLESKALGPGGAGA